MDARRLVEEALGAARAAGDDAAARDARRMVEQAIGEHAEPAEREDAVPGPGEAASIIAGARVRLPSGGTGEVLELRAEGTAVVAAGAMKIVLDAASLTPLPPGGRAARKETRAPAGTASSRQSAVAALEVDLRGLTGDEAEQATIAAMDAAVLAEQPFLRIIHGMGTGVVRERVRRVVSGDRRVSRFGFAPRNQGGTGVTVVEFSA
jgi:DNA mismatch repair protein MutS2